MSPTAQRPVGDHHVLVGRDVWRVELDSDRVEPQPSTLVRRPVATNRRSLRTSVPFASVTTMSLPS